MVFIYSEVCPKSEICRNVLKEYALSYQKMLCINSIYLHNAFHSGHCHKQTLLKLFIGN